MTEIIMQTYEVLNEIKHDQIYSEIKKLNRMINQKYQEEINRFNQAKNVYQDVLNQGGTYHPDYKKVIKEMSEAKQKLYTKEEVKSYLELEKKFELDLNSFLAQISKSISSYIKTPNKLGIVTKGGSCHVG